MRPRFALVGLMYLAVANSALAVGYGWQELPDGGIEFLFRVEPGLLESVPLATADLPPGLPEIRRIRVMLNNDDLPNEGTLPKPVVQTAKPAIEYPASSPTQDVQYLSSEKITGLPPPPWDNKPTPFTESPKAMPIDNPPNGIVNSTHVDRNPKQAAATTQAGTPEKEQPPSLEGNGGVGGKNETTSQKVEVPESRPWLPLTGTLVALFASLGTNAYLAWIHQTLRSNYRALVTRMKGDAATA